MNTVFRNEADFYTTSYKDVIHAIYFQGGKQPKLVCYIWEHIWDAVVNLRMDSLIFKQWQSFNLIGKKRNGFGFQWMRAWLFSS